MYTPTQQRLDIRPLPAVEDWPPLALDYLPTWCDGVRFTWAPDTNVGQVEYRSRSWLPHATLTLCALPPGARQQLAWDVVGACDAGECPWRWAVALPEEDVTLYRAVWDAGVLPGDPFEWQFESVADFERAVGTRRLPAAVKADLAELVASGAAGTLPELAAALTAAGVPLTA